MISSFIPLWSEKVLGMIFILLNWWLILSPHMWDVVGMFCALQKDVCSAALGGMLVKVSQFPSGQCSSPLTTVGLCHY